MNESPIDLAKLAFGSPSPISSSSLYKAAANNTTNNADNYTNEAIENRAQELGITDQEYYWIAEKSLVAVLPDNWVECTTDDGYIYYYNDDTDESVWEHPGLDKYKQLYMKVLKDKGVVLKENNTLYNSPKQTSKEQPKGSTSTPQAWNNENNMLATINENRDKENFDNDSRRTPSNYDATPTKRTPSNNSSHGTSDRSDRSYSNSDESDYDGEKEKEDEEDEHIDLEKPENYWHHKYEEMHEEKNRIDALNRKIEGVLQQSVMEQSKLHDEKHRLEKKIEDCAKQLREAGEKSLNFIEERGYSDINPLKNYKANDYNLLTTVAENNKILETLTIAIQSNPDDKGYFKSWEGLSNRLTTEMHNCFQYDSRGKHTGTDIEELKARVEMLAQLVSTFGEYVAPEARKGYIHTLVKHIALNASGNTMVPLEMIIEQLPTEYRAKVDEKIERYVTVEPPSVVSKLRTELESERTFVIQLQAKLDKKAYDYDILQTELIAVRDQLKGFQNREEGMENKFDQLIKSMGELRDAQKVGFIESNASITAQDVLALQEEMNAMTEELNLANKRAAEAERRNEEMLLREKEIVDDVKTLESTLTRKLEKKSTKCHDLASKCHELERVTKEMYNELQTALGISARLDSENSTLRLQLDLAKGGENAVEKLKFLLEDETNRCKGLEQVLAGLREDIIEAQELKVKAEEAAKISENEMNAAFSALNKIEKQQVLEKHSNSLLKEENQSFVEKIESLKKALIASNERIIEIQGNVRVFCRVRPLFRHEQSSDVVRYLDYNMLDFNSTPYEFDRVFPPDSDQDDMFYEIEPAIKSLFNGNKVCLLAYGETGAGKSYTMMGTTNRPGIIKRSFQSIFANIKSNPDIQTTVIISMLDIYNETVTDLLAEEIEPLDIKVGKGGVYVENLSEWNAFSYKEVEALVYKAEQRKKNASNEGSDRSSRSHVITIARVDTENLQTGQVLSGFIYLIDLAGSERVRATSVSNHKLREGQNINNSLVALGDVIDALGKNQKHVPYRSSKLTFLLQDVLKPHSKVLMFVNINPSVSSINESINSLSFAARCRSVQLGKSKSSISYQIKDT